MKNVDLAALTEPLSEADPCGPDLELADDDEYLNAIVTTETVLPPEYFVFSDYIGSRQPYDQDRRYADLDLKGRVAAVLAFVEQTRDIRLYILLAKLYVLGKDLASAEACVEAVAVLLETLWDKVHPTVADSGEELRREVLQRLDDTLILTALPHVPLVPSKRLGAVTWHRYLTEARKTGGTGDEPADFDRSLAEEGQTDLGILLPLRDGLGNTRALLDRFIDALKRIRAVCTEHMEDGPPRIPGLEELLGRLRRFVDRIYRLVEAAVVQVDPSAAREAPAEAAPETLAESGAEASVQVVQVRPLGALKSADEATAALAAAVVYFERFEPSNPALLLLKQAQELIGKSFLDAMQILIPDHAAKAVLEVGSAKTFTLPLARLASSVYGEGGEAGEAVPNGHAVPEREPVVSRSEAVALLGQVGAYFREAEPSSPIPMLTDGARALTGKDFMTLLADVLPKDALKAAGGPK